MTRRRRSVAMIVAATLVTATTLVLGGLGLVSYLRDREEKRTRVGRVAEVEANVLAVSLALPIWNIDRPQIEKVLEAMGATPGNYAVVVQAAGATHARVRDAHWRFVPSDGRFATDGLASVRRDIVFNGEQIGTVQVYATPKFVEAELRRSLLWLVLSILTVDVLLVLCVYFALRPTVLRPLVEIERFAVAVSEGARPPSIGGAGGAAELASLRASIESMVRLLDARYAELQKQEEELRQSERMSAIGKLVAGVAHEVRNPLFGISAALDALEAELDKGPDLEEYMKALRSDVSRLSRLMNDLLEYGRPQKLAPHEQSILPVVAEAVRMCGPRAREKHIELRQQTPEALPIVAIDADRMVQVFKNVVENAIEFSPAGDAVAISLREEDGGAVAVVCTVADRGPGFRAADLPHVFDPFFTRRPGGTGLGLAIVQKIVADHGGSVAAMTGSEGGATSEIRLPAAGLSQ
jgi:signal transduction histidine kinase